MKLIEKLVRLPAGVKSRRESRCGGTWKCFRFLVQLQNLLSATFSLLFALNIRASL